MTDKPMPDCECEGGSCILCKVIALLDKAAELQGGDHDQGLELILFAAGSLPATVEGYTYQRMIDRIRQAYTLTERDIQAAMGDAPGEGAARH